MMVRLAGWLICADTSQAAVVSAHLDEHIRLSRAEPGCLRFDVVATDDPLVWRIDEIFTDEAALAAHRTRVAASTWGCMTARITRDFRVMDG